MKPRNKRESQVLALVGQLHPLTQQHSDFMKSAFGHYLYYRLNGQCRCSVCGYEFGILPGIAKYWQTSLIEQIFKDEDEPCPECGTSLLPKYMRGKFQDTETKSMQVMDVCEGWQVMRYVEMTRRNMPGRATEYDMHELSQNWFNEKGQEVIVSRPYTRSYNYLIYRSMDTWTIAHHNQSYVGSYYYEDMFTGEAQMCYPATAVSQALKRNGWVARLGSHVTPYLRYQIVKGLLTDPKIETLAKSGCDRLVKFYSNSVHSLEHWWPQIRIAVRHHYKIKDVQMWQDMLSFLEELEKDLHSPFYICPDNMRKAHEHWHKKVMRKRKAQELREAAEKDKCYYNAHKQFSGLVITGILNIRPLMTVSELVEEGAAMHHCVGTYGNKMKSLILSVRDGKKRLETVEVDLHNYVIVQSRGACNISTPRHDEILAAVTKLLPEIRKCNMELKQAQ